jgi:predicted nucleic acid-binding protein
MNEPGSKEARAAVAEVLKKGQMLCTVDFALAESLNVVWKHANVLKDLEPKEAASAAEDLARVYDGLNVVATRELAEETTRIALTENITVYDALYVAAAQKLNGTLYTADRKLCATANKTTNTKLLKHEE